VFGAGFLAAFVAGLGAVAISPAAAAPPVSTEAALRAALALPGTTDVVLANSIDLTDCGAGGGDLDRAGAVTIDGAGFTITQTCPGERVLESTSGTLTLQSITITGGSQTGSGAVLGGGVRAAGDLVLDDATVSGNSLSGDGVFGGGVEADGAITLIASHVDENTATSTAGSYGAGVLGGAGQDVTITDSSVDGNTAMMTSDEDFRGVDGGGVALLANHNNFAPVQPMAGTVHLVRSSVSGNDVRAATAGQSPGSQALVLGGGIYAATAVLDASHVDGNELDPSNAVSAVGWGGGVAALTALTANDSTLDRNVIAPDGPLGIAEGGAAFVPQGPIVLTDSSAQENQVAVDGASGYAYCGALLAFDATLTGSTISHNVASAPTFAFAGGVCASKATIATSKIEANSVTSPTGEAFGGGAVFEEGEIRDTTLSTNNASGAISHGGAVTQAELTSGDPVGTLTFVNSTVSGNQATGPASSAGGIDLPGQIAGLPAGTGTVSLVFTTVASNAAASGANIRASASDSAVTTFASTISTPLGGGTNCAGVTPTDQGYTQVTDTSCGTTAAGDPQLSALGDNGGPTETMLPSATSPLLDQVPSDACLALITTDQRGVTRPQGSACDVGAVEREVPVPPDIPAPPIDGLTAAPAAVVAEPRFTG
jgi:hypothetical protein